MTVSISNPMTTGPTTDADVAFMERALELAAGGIALTSPNPMVGAVVVRDGIVIGEGFHTFEGVKHAEILALEAAGESARGATLYINLEPCCHTGRTGPCTQAVIAAGIKRVVAAMADPNPAVAGRGFKKLRAAGIEISTGLLEAEAKLLNEAFARWIVLRKPLVTLKSALTLDGKLVLPHTKKTAGKQTLVPLKDRWISSPESRDEVQSMRHASDALMTGIGTVLVDNPFLTDRTELPRRRKLLRVVMDSRLRLPLRSNLVLTAHDDVLVFTLAKTNSPKAQALRDAGVEVVRLKKRGSQMDLADAVEALGRRNILSVLLEAGATLNSSAVAAGIVDKMRVFFAPKFAGDGGKSPRARSASTRIPSISELQDVTMQPSGPDFAIEGYLRDVYRNR